MVVKEAVEDVDVEEELEDAVVEERVDVAEGLHEVVVEEGLYAVVMEEGLKDIVAVGKVKSVVNLTAYHHVLYPLVPLTLSTNIRMIFALCEILGHMFHLVPKPVRLICSSFFSTIAL